MPEDLKAAAEEYYRQGFNIVVSKGKDKPLMKWAEAEVRGQTQAEFDTLPWDQADTFGVICGTPNHEGLFLGVVDLDSKNLTEEAMAKGREAAKHLPITRTDRTLNKGLHYVYLTRAKPDTISLYHDEAALELLGEGKLCWMAPSKGYSRLNDNSMTVVEDLEAKFLSALQSIGINPSKPEYEKEATKQHDKIGLDISKVIELKGFSHSGDEFYGPHPFHDSPSKNGHNLWVNTSKNVWHCFRCDSGGGALSLLAVKHGLLACAEARPGALKGELFTKVLKIAEQDYGLKIPEGKKKPKQLHSDSGETEEGSFEAIYDNGEPRFLVNNDGHFSIVEKLEVNGKDCYPREFHGFPYLPYGYYDGSTPTREELYKLIRKECQTWIDVEPIWHDVIASCIMLTYQQQKTQTIPYLYLYGDNESGKTTILTVINALAYRPMFGITIPSADLYGFLEDTDGSGCILEDEIQGIEDDTDKIKIYKAGYKQGAVVPRMLMTENDRIIKYYRVFCFKAVSSERISTVKGFNERFILIPMVEGTPEKEWVDLSREDKERQEQLRNMLLRWRMETRTEDLPNVELAVKGRIKELWKPILQITSGLAVHNTLSNFVEEQRKERLSIRQDTLEGKIVKVIVDLYGETGELSEVHFQTIWDQLTLELKGTINEAKPNVMDTADFYEVTKNKVGYRLREVLSGKKTVGKDKDRNSVKAYSFDREKLRRIAKKYGFTLSTKLPSLPSLEGMLTPEKAEKTIKTPQKSMEKEGSIPPKLGNSVDLVDNMIQCAECKNRGKKVFFASDRDLKTHCEVYHDES